MKIVVVGGSASNVGKTTLATRLIRRYADRCATVALKVSVRERPCATTVTTVWPGQEIEHRKDTGRLLEAGARCVVWVTVHRPLVRAGLARGLAAARRLRPAVVVAESTSAGIELRRIADSWFVAGENEWKPWAHRHCRRADHIVRTAELFEGVTMAGPHSSGSVARRAATAAAVALVAWFTTAAAQADQGSDIFASKCSACHTIGGGKKVGPDLKGITTTENPTFLHQWVSSPSALIKAGDPTATRIVKQYPMQMPDLGLSSSDVDAVLAYIAQQSGGTASKGAGATAAMPALPPGDAAVGRETFVGSVRLHNGGPPCMSCHSISGIGALGGGTLGPDLTDAYHKYGGDAGLASFLQTVPTPTMSAVWSREPLTPQEIANLVAFIREGAVAQRPLSAIGRLAALGVIGLIILVIILATYWRRRLRGVRIPLVQRANERARLRYNRTYAGRS